MSKPEELVRDRLREIERSFTAFERGDRNRLYETRDSLLGLTGAIESSDANQLAPLSEIASRLLGLVIMEGGLTEARSVDLVRELLGFIEAQLMKVQPTEEPGGVFHIVNSEKVGDILVRRGLLQPDQVHKALLLQRVSKGRRIGQVLVAMNAIDQRTLDDVLNGQKNETRRAETRRGSGGVAATPSTLGMSSIPLSPLPALPPMPGAAPEPPPALPQNTDSALPPAAPLEPGVNAPGLNAPRINDAGFKPKIGLDWLDGK